MCGSPDNAYSIRHQYTTPAELSKEIRVQGPGTGFADDCRSENDADAWTGPPSAYRQPYRPLARHQPPQCLRRGLMAWFERRQGRSDPPRGHPVKADAIKRRGWHAPCIRPALCIGRRGPLARISHRLSVLSGPVARLLRSRSRSSSTYFNTPPGKRDLRPCSQPACLAQNSLP